MAKLRDDCSNVTGPKQGVADGLDASSADRWMKERVHARQRGRYSPFDLEEPETI
jgi:hypothetical protein